MRFLIAILLFLFPTASWAVNCDSQLINAMRTHYNLSSSQSFAQAYKMHVCRQWASSGSESWGGSYSGYGLEHGSSSSQMEKLCRDARSSIDIKNVVNRAYEALPPEAIKLLSGCFPGPRMKVEVLTERDVSFLVTYVPSNNDDQYPRYLGGLDWTKGLLDCEDSHRAFQEKPVPVGVAGVHVDCKRQAGGYFSSAQVTALLFNDKQRNEQVDSAVAEVPADRLFNTEYNLVFYKTDGDKKYARCVEKGVAGPQKNAAVADGDFRCRDRVCQDAAKLEGYCGAVKGNFRWIKPGRAPVTLRWDWRASEPVKKNKQLITTCTNKDASVRAEFQKVEAVCRYPKLCKMKGHWPKFARAACGFAYPYQFSEEEKQGMGAVQLEAIKALVD